MQKAMSAMEYQKKLLIGQGFRIGSFEMAIKIKHEFGIEKALEMSDFSRHKLESEKLDDSPFPF